MSDDLQETADLSREQVLLGAIGDLLVGGRAPTAVLVHPLHPLEAAFMVAEDVAFCESTPDDIAAAHVCGKRVYQWAVSRYDAKDWRGGYVASALFAFCEAVSAPNEFLRAASFRGCETAIRSARGWRPEPAPDPATATWADVIRARP